MCCCLSNSAEFLLLFYCMYVFSRVCVAPFSLNLLSIESRLLITVQHVISFLLASRNICFVWIQLLFIVTLVANWNCAEFWNLKFGQMVTNSLIIGCGFTKPTDMVVVIPCPGVVSSTPTITKSFAQAVYNYRTRTYAT